MKTIDLNRMRKALPDRAVLTVHKKNGVLYFRVKVTPELSEQDFTMVKQFHREILGKLLREFYTEETGHDWFIYLKKEPIELVNMTDEDVNSLVKMSLVKEGKLA